MEPSTGFGERIQIAIKIKKEIREPTSLGSFGAASQSPKSRPFLRETKDDD